MKEPKIIKKPEVCGGRPIIDGTRIKVSQVALEFEYMGMTADEIIQSHPHLTLSQIHTALSYYYLHAGEIKKEIRENKEFVEHLKKNTASSIRHMQYA